MDFHVISDTPLPPMDVVRDLPSEETWWTVRVRDQFGSTIHADPVRLDLMSLLPLPVGNARTGKRYGFIEHAILEAQPGDTLILDPAIYELNVTMSMPLNLSSLDPNNPTVVAQTILWGQDTEKPTITFSGPESMGSTLAGLTIANEAVCLSCRDAEPTIRNCVVASSDSISVEFWHGHRPQFIDCTFVGQVREGGDPGLIAYWRLDETEGVIAHDSEGNNNANVIGDPIWRSEDGMIGGALQFDGLNDFLKTEFVCNPSVSPFSIFAWIKGGAAGEVILSQAGADNWLMADPTTGSLATELKGTGRFGKALISSQVITDDLWHRIGLAWDGSNRILYIDDVEVATDTQASPNTSWDGLHIGTGSMLLEGTFWSGLIDDVWVYDFAVKP